MEKLSVKQEVCCEKRALKMKTMILYLVENWKGSRVTSSGWNVCSTGATAIFFLLEKLNKDKYTYS